MLDILSRQDANELLQKPVIAGCEAGPACCTVYRSEFPATDLSLSDRLSGLPHSLLTEASRDV